MAWRSKTLSAAGALEVSEAVVAIAKHDHYLAEGEVRYQKYYLDCSCRMHRLAIARAKGGSFGWYSPIIIV